MTDISEQLRRAMQQRGLTEWVLARRAEMSMAQLGQVMGCPDDATVEMLLRVARALDLDVTLAPAEPGIRVVGPVPTVVDRVVLRLTPERVAFAQPSVPQVLALGLKGTLISNAVGAFVRPGLFRFLTCCRPLFSRLVIFTAVKEPRFRELAAQLVAEGSAPSWFADVEYVNWSGATKDLTFVPHTSVDDVLLLDDLAEYVHPGQEARWIRIKGYEPPLDAHDKELDRVLEELVRHVSPHGRFA